MTALRAAAGTRSVKLALTAGLNSRAMLAVALQSGVPIEAYTYGRGQDTLVDRTLAADLAASVGIQHTRAPSVPMTQGLREQLMDAHYSPHHRPAVPSLRAWVDDRSAVAVSANLLEIGRSFFRRRRDAGISPPVNAKAMAELHRSSAGGAGLREIRQYGNDRHLTHSSSALSEYIATSDVAGASFLDPFESRPVRHLGIDENRFRRDATFEAPTPPPSWTWWTGRIAPTVKKWLRAAPRWLAQTRRDSRSRPTRDAPAFQSA